MDIALTRVDIFGDVLVVNVYPFNAWPKTYGKGLVAYSKKQDFIFIL